MSNTVHIFPIRLPKSVLVGNTVCSNRLLGAIKAYNFTTLHDNTLTDAEYQVFLAAMNWLYHDVGGRRRYVFDILKYIRLPLVPTKQLDEFQAQCAALSLQVALTR